MTAFDVEAVRAEPPATRTLATLRDHLIARACRFRRAAPNHARLRRPYRAAAGVCRLRSATPIS